MPIVELQNKGVTRDEQDNLRRRDAAFAQLMALAPTRSGDRMPAVGVLGPVPYMGGVYTTAVDVQAVGKATVTTSAQFTATAIVRGVTFQQTVVVGPTGNAVFDGCTFMVPVLVEAGGVIACVGCRFDGTAAITNRGYTVNANRVGCGGSSALAADLNVTIIGGK